MGSAKLNLSSLELNRAEELTIKLEDAQRATKDLGEIKLGVTLWPKTQEDKEQVSPPIYITHVLELSVKHFIFHHRFHFALLIPTKPAPLTVQCAYVREMLLSGVGWNLATDFTAINFCYEHSCDRLSRSSTIWQFLIKGN